MDISAMVISVITYVAIIEMLANGLVGDCLANQIRLQRVWGDPDFYPQSLSNLWGDVGGGSKTENLFAHGRILLEKSIQGQGESGELIYQFLQECCAQQKPGVYTNGMQFGLAFLRRHLLLDYFSLLSQTETFKNDIPSNAVLKFGKMFGLSNHEFALCNRAMHMLPTIKDFEFGPIIIVPARIFRFKTDHAFSESDFRKLLHLLQDTGGDQVQYLSVMPEIVYLLEKFFADAENEVQVVEVATAFSSMIKRFPHPCLLWAMGFLSEEFYDDKFYRVFLQKVTEMCGCVTVVIEATPGIVSCKFELSIHDVVNKLFNVIMSKSSSTDIEIPIDID